MDFRCWFSELTGADGWSNMDIKVGHGWWKKNLLRSENSDFLMIFKIVGEFQLGSYTESETSNTPHIQCTRFPILLTLIILPRSVDESEVSASIKGPNLTSPTILNFTKKSEFSLLRGLL